MPINDRNLPYKYKRQPPRFVEPQNVQGNQGRWYNKPGAINDLSLLAMAQPAAAPASLAAAAPVAATPIGVPAAAKSQQGWWAGLGAGGQSALLRSALAAGSAMLERTDPYATNPLTAASAGLLKGFEAHDIIKEEQRKEGLRGRLAGISAEQPSAAYAGEVARTLAAGGDVTGALSAFQAQSRLMPQQPKPGEGLRTVSPGQGIYDPRTGETTVPVERPPAEARIFNVGGRLYRYDKETQGAIPLTDREAKEFTLGRGAIRYKQGPGGEITEIARGTEISPELPEAPLITKGREARLRSTVENIIAKELGEPPEEYTAFGIKDIDYLKKKRQYDTEVEATRKRLMIQYGLATPEEFEPKPEDILGPPAPLVEAQTNIPAKYKVDFDTLKANPNNAGFTDQQLLDALKGR